MKYLLDTNALIVAITNPQALSPRYQQILADPDNDLVVSPASIWEMAIKVRLGKLDFQTDVSLEQLAVQLRRQLKVRLLPIKQRHLLHIAALPKIAGHGDPFDLLIIAQALTENLPVLTSDGQFYRYGVAVVG